MECGGSTASFKRRDPELATLYSPDCDPSARVEIVDKVDLVALQDASQPGDGAVAPMMIWPEQSR
jgi:hypothetical protein